MMTFLEAYKLHGPDVERIADELGIAPHEADRLINAKMNERHTNRTTWQRTKAANAEIRKRYA